MVFSVKIRAGVENISFDASHYTPGVESKCRNIHGHTYRLSVEVEGKLDPSTGMVIDFLILKRIVREIIDEYDHKLIIPRKDLDKTIVKGEFNTVYKVIDYPVATTEYIALDIARKIYERLGLFVRVKLYEGNNNYVIVEYNGE